MNVTEVSMNSKGITPQIKNNKSLRAQYLSTPNCANDCFQKLRNLHRENQVSFTAVVDTKALAKALSKFDFFVSNDSKIINIINRLDAEDLNNTEILGPLRELVNEAYDKYVHEAICDAIKTTKSIKALEYLYYDTPRKKERPTGLESIFGNDVSKKLHSGLPIISHMTTKGIVSKKAQLAFLDLVEAIGTEKHVDSLSDMHSESTAVIARIKSIINAKGSEGGKKAFRLVEDKRMKQASKAEMKKAAKKAEKAASKLESDET